MIVSSYVIYLPGKQGANPEHLAAVGLGELAKERSPEFADCLDGTPDGSRGLLAAWRTGDTANDPPFDPRAFEWQPAKADSTRGLEAARFWFGVERGKKVAPATLARRESIAGYPVELADGQVWRVACLDKLPRKLSLNDRGRFVATVKPEHLGLVSQGEQFALQFFHAVGEIELLMASKPHLDPNAMVEFTLENAADFAVDILKLNYRLTSEVADFLGILDQQAIIDIVKVSIELTALLKGRPESAPQTVNVVIR